MTSTHKMMFLGPSGAGKTTLLASLYRELPSVLKSRGNSQLRCVDSDRERDLREKVEEVERVEENKLFTFETTLTGTQALQRYPFELSDQERALLDFEIIDHKGGDISLNTLEQGSKRELVESLKESDVVLVVVDAAIMMADPVGVDANRFNQYIAVSEYLRQRIMESDRPLLVQFLLTKSERWWREDVRSHPKRGEALLKEAQKSLSPSLN
jgi:GTPase SAR1 family protein